MDKLERVCIKCESDKWEELMKAWIKVSSLICPKCLNEVRETRRKVKLILSIRNMRVEEKLLEFWNLIYKTSNKY